MKTRDVQIVWATSPARLEQVRSLFVDYAQSLGFSLEFQGFANELASLPGAYAPPDGRLLLATAASEPAGCAGLRRLSSSTCEMKRLYVRAAFRGQGLGRRLAQAIISEARSIQYSTMRLDTIAGKMNPAIELYRSLGYVEIAPYRRNPVPGVLYMELSL